MGNPQNFSLDVPRRCQRLIEDLWPLVSKKHGNGSLPLNASFLLAISTPIVNLPIERIWKPAMNQTVGHLNDSVLDTRLATMIRKGVGSGVLENAAFYVSGAWRYSYLPKGSGLPNLALHGLPPAVEVALTTSTAEEAAKTMSTQLFCSILRNGLAHGGVLFLDEFGHTSHAAPVRMFCFVSTKQTRRSGIEGLHFLRVGMKEYRAFLGLWAHWLGDSANPVVRTT